MRECLNHVQNKSRTREYRPDMGVGQPLCLLVNPLTGVNRGLPWWMWQARYKPGLPIPWWALQKMAFPAIKT